MGYALDFLNNNIGRIKAPSLGGGAFGFDGEKLTPEERADRQEQGLLSSVRNLGYEPPPEKNNITPLEKFLNLLSIGQYASADLASGLLGQNPGLSGKGIGGFFEDLSQGKGLENLFGQTENAGDYGALTPLAEILDGIKAGLSMEGGRKSDYQDIVRDGLGTADTGNINADIGLNFLRETAGSALNIFGDPLTYVSSGLGKAGQIGSKALKEAGAGAKGLNILDNAGKNFAAETLGRKYADDMIKAGIISEEDAAKKAFEYSKNMREILEKDRGGIKLNLPGYVDTPTGQKEFHIPFFKESDWATGTSLIDQKTLNKTGIPQGFQAAVSNVKGETPDLPDMKLYLDIGDQIKNEPSGLFTRIFIRPKGALKFNPAEFVDDAAKEMNILEKSAASVDPVGEYAKLHKMNPEQVQELRNIQDAIDVISKRDDFKEMSGKIGDQKSAKDIEQAKEYKYQLMKETAQAVYNKDLTQLSTKDWIDLQNKIWAVSGGPELNKIKELSGEAWGNRPKVGVEKTILGTWVDKTMEVLNKEYHLPLDFKNILRGYHMANLLDEQEIAGMVDQSRQFFKNEADMKEAYLHLLKPSKYKIRPELKEGADWLQKIYDPTRADSPINYQALHNLIRTRKEYGMNVVLQRGPKNPKDIIGKSELSSDTAREYMQQLESILYYYNQMVKDSPGAVKHMNNLINDVVRGNKDIDLKDPSMFRRMITDIDEAIAQGRDPIMDIPTLIKMRFSGAYKVQREHELMENLKKLSVSGNGSEAVIKIPESIQSSEALKNMDATPAGYINGDTLNIPQLKGHWVEEQTAKYLIRHYMPRNIHPLLEQYDRLLSQWKYWMTIPNPSFHTRNAFGNFLNNWFGGVNDLKPYEQAFKIQSLKPDKLAGYKISLPDGSEISGSKLKALAHEYGILNSYTQDLITGSGFGNTIKKGFQKAMIPFELGGKNIENNARLAHFLDKIQKGYSLDQAAASVKKHLFDYSDLAPGDENMKRLIPFWVWMRNNVPLQIENLIRHPGKMAYLPKLKHYIEGGSRNSERKENNHLPAWLRESYNLNLSDNGFNGNPAILKLNLPQEDITRYLDSKEIMGGLTPAAKIPLELFFNKNSYFGSDIVPEGLENDPKLQTVKTQYFYKYLKDLPAIGKLLNIKVTTDKNGRERTEMDAKMNHLLSAVTRPLVETGKLGDPETDDTIGILSFLGPARVYSYSPERQAVFEQQERIQRLQAVLRKLRKEQVRDGIGRGSGR